LIKLPNGQTLFSYQTNEDWSSEWLLSTMEVAIGNREAKDFGFRTRPFPIRLHQQAKWNSLAVWDENTIVALSSVDLYSDTIAPWMIKGYLIPERIFVEEEITEYPIFIGSESTGSARIGIGGKRGEIQFRCIVSGIDDAGAGGMDFFFYMEGNQYKLHCDENGSYQFYREERNQWQPTERDVLVTFLENSEGYEFLISVSTNPETKNIRFGAALSFFDEKGIPFTEYLVHMEEMNIDSWIEIYLK